MYISKKLLIIAATSFLGTALAFPAHAETISGCLEKADFDSIDGWAWNVGEFDQVVDVELHIIPDGSSKAARTLKVTADAYREDLHHSIKDGWHGFSCPVDWDDLSGDAFSITAYVVTEEGRTRLPETITYKKIPIVEPKVNAGIASSPEAAIAPGPEAGPVSQVSAASGSQLDTVSTAAPYGLAAGSESESTTDTGSHTKADTGSGTTVSNTPRKPVEEVGPGVSKLTASSSASGKKGESLGIFTITGYCSCSLCSDGHSKTYSGTIPQASHTISADLSVLPLNTKVMINDIIYTVEDKGSSVAGNKIDIYYGSHEEAVAHGKTQEEVFAVELP